MRPVGTALVETTATVRSRSAVSEVLGARRAEQVEAEVDVDARRAGALLAAATGSRVMRRSETTGPPFCVRPVWSRPDTWQAVEQRRHAEHLADGHDAGAADARSSARRSPRRRRAGSRLGQLDVERTACACFALLARARPSGTTGSRPRGTRSPCCRRPGGSASCGRTRSRPASTDRQLDFSPQSPQPSQTRSLITTRSAARAPCRACAGGAARPRTPGRGSGRSRPRRSASSLLRGEQLACGRAPRRSPAQRDAAVAARVLGGDDDPRDALERRASGSSVGDAQLALDAWPPVIATCSL